MKVKLYILSFVLLLLTVACTTVEQDMPSSKADMTFVAEWADTQTKTAFQADETSIWWSPADEICIYYGASEGNKFTSTNDAEVPKAEFRGTLNAFTGESEAGVAYYFWAVYPYESAVSCDGESVVATLADEQMAKAGSFAPNTNIAIAKSTGLNLSFYNACSWFRFSVTKEGVKRVIFRGNNDEDVTGKFRVSMGEDNRPTAPEVIEGKKEITLHLPEYEPFEVGKIYYITLFPQVFTKGFTVTFKTDTEIATRSISAKATFLRSKYNSGIGFDSPEKGVVYTEDPNAEDLSEESEGGTESGLYFGLSTFERFYKYYPVKLISEESLYTYESTIDALQLTNLNGTILYYSIDEDITAMQRIPLPSDLTTVSIVTFTDGFDEGSTNYHYYDTDDEYLDYLNKRMITEVVSGIPIKSYAIGLKGPDANSDIVSFRDCLSKLASTPNNSSEKYVYEIDANQFSQLREAFTSIAKDLSESIKLYSISVHFTPPSDGQLIRITFDIDNPEIKNAKSSSFYIEGVFSKKDWLLSDVIYHGFNANPGQEIHITKYDGFEVYFDFEGLQPEKVEQEISNKRIHTWKYNQSTSTWRVNTESTSGELPTVKVRNSSALVLLNLDLSHSLEGRLPDLKKYSKEFISTLYTSSVDPNVVKTVRLNKTEMSLLAGKTEALVATVSPSTANIASLKWESAIPSVATVDQNGNVSGVSEGTTIVTVKSEDGKAKASCTIHVSFQHVESISLNKSELTMYEGKTETLFAAIMPIDASDASVSWTSSAPDVATVSSSGVVKALSKGSATITAKTTDGEKTATCNVVVTDYTPSTNPIDLSLVVYSPTLNRRGYITNEELQYVNLSEYTVEGLAVLSASGDFMIALEDASSSGIVYSAASLFYQLPSYNQGMTISARFQEINNALSEFGGRSLNSSSYYWTSGTSSSANSLYCIYGSGGKLYDYNKTGYVQVREVAPLTSWAPCCFVTKSQGLSLAYYDANGKRCFAKKRDDVPLGCTIEGLAVESSSGKGNVIIALEDANSTPITWEAARNVYNMENMITEEEGRLISARFQEINNALSEFGGSSLLSSYYWTSGTYSANYHYCICGSGGSLSAYNGTAYLRLKKGTATTSNPVFAITLATPTDYLNNRTSSVAFTAFKVDAATIDFTMDDSTAPAFNVEILKSDDGLLTTIPAGTTGYTYAEGTDKWGITGTGGIDAVKLRGIPTLPLWNYVDDKTYYGTLTIKNSLGYTVATMKVAFTKTLPTAAPSGYSVKTGLLNASGVYNCYMVPNNWTANAATNGTMAMLNVFNFPAGLASNYIISFAESNKNASGAFIPVTVAGNGTLSVDKSYIDNTKQHATSVVYNFGDISSVRHADASIADKNVYVGVDSFPTVYNCIYNSTYTWAWKWSVGKNASGAVTSSDYPGWSGATPVPGFFQTVAPTTTMTPEIFYNDFDGQTMPIANIQGCSHWDSAYNAPLNSPLNGSLAIQSAKLTSNANGVEEYYTVDTGLKFTKVSGATNPTVDVPSTLTITCKDMYGHDVNVKMPVIVKRR